MRKLCPECGLYFWRSSCSCGYKIEGRQAPKKIMISDCNYCRNNGLIFATKDNCEYVFKCNRCENSNAKYKIWQDKLCLEGYSWQDNGPRFDPKDPEQMKGLVYIKENIPKLYDEFLRQHPQHVNLLQTIAPNEQKGA